MKNYLRSGFPTLVFLLTLYACETDFSTIDSFEDITVVYGLIDTKDSIQYIKINRAFLSEDNVMTYAAERDSNEYLHKLEVRIEEWTPDGSTLIKTHLLDSTTVYDKEPGQFYYPDQTLYRLPKPDQPYDIKYIVEGLNDTVGIEVFWLNYLNLYKLFIRNPETGKEIRSETPLVQDFRIVKPGFGQTIRFVQDPVAPTEFEWERAENGELYEFELRFNYGERFEGSQDTVYKYITLASTTTTGGNSGSTLSYFYWGDQFFVACQNLIPYSDPSTEASVLERFTGLVEVIVRVAEEEYALYIEVNAPSTSIVQDRPNYSNIENGLGIFSSRFEKNKTKILHPESVNDLKDLEPDLKFVF
jgi:hypothetical protein